MNIILASASPRRRELLSQLGIDFKIVVADVDESIVGSPSPDMYVKELALRKARAAAGTAAGFAPPAASTAASTAAAGSEAYSPSAVSRRNPVLPEQQGVVVIGADTVVVTEDGEILGKPRDDRDAKRMLAKLCGKWHDVYTGLALIFLYGERTHAERTRVKMRVLDESAILRYIDTGEPRDKAGAYAIQGFGSLLIERVEGCFYNVVGLPLSALDAMLAEFGGSLL